MEFCDTAPVLHAIAIAEAPDEPLDIDPVASVGMHPDMPAHPRASDRSHPPRTR
jgi:hypothetical protein